MTKSNRRQELEAKFCALFVERAKHQELAKQHEQEAQRLHDELMRLQGAISEVERLPDDPPEADQVGG